MRRCRRIRCESPAPCLVAGFSSRARRPGAFFLAMATALALSAPSPVRADAKPPPSVTIASSTLPAKDRQDTTFSVPDFGRYAIKVTSEQGVGIQVVDPMTGPSYIAGQAGERDGRIDLFLDQGTYKLRTYAHPEGSGTARIEVLPFRELNGEDVPLLPELKTVHAPLDDLEQRSYWIDVPKRQNLVLEGAGRNLSDIRLWRDGTWLVDASARCSQRDPAGGQPLNNCTLTTRLEPGLYLLTAYGGPELPWAKASDEHPFYLRAGFPNEGTSGRHRHEISAFGVDRYLVGGDATYFRLELFEATDAELRVARYNPSGLEGWRSRKIITKETNPPVADVSVSRVAGGLHMVSVYGRPGLPYVLQHFKPVGRSFSFRGQGKYWLSTVHSGALGDAIDATGIIRERPRSGGRDELTDGLVPTMDHANRYSRRCNILGNTTLFVAVTEAGRYRIESRGVLAQFRMEPYLTSKPRGYQPPPYQQGGGSFDLEVGLHVLSIVPVEKGIMDITLEAAKPGEEGLEGEGTPDDSAVARTPVQASLHFPNLKLDSSKQYTLELNAQPGVKVGVIFRRIPIDLSEPLPLTQFPGEKLPVSVEVPEAGMVVAEAEDGSWLELSLDAVEFTRGVAVTAGQHVIYTWVDGDQTLTYTLRFIPTVQLEDTPLPSLTAEARARLPDFRPLTEDKQQFFDLDRGAAATYGVRVDSSAQYRLESTGLLETRGTVRTRTRPSLATAASNGEGRNFVVQSYLRSGDYQVTVTALSKSRGHLGLKLERTELLDGGVLTIGAPARVTLAAGEAIFYRFAIDEKARYRLQSIGQGRGFTSRLEDADGWPLEASVRPQDSTFELRPGDYRLRLMPELTESRRLTLLERLPEPLHYEGHGPHVLPIARRLEHTWTDPTGDAPGPPDVWTFELSAMTRAAIELTSEMEGVLKKVPEEGKAAVVAEILPNRGWEGLIKAGRYQLEVRNKRRNNRVDYNVALWPESLLGGLSRWVTAPASIPIAVGERGVTELYSFGAADVRARLESADGRTVALNDDRPEGWNFYLLQPLPAGEYRLELDPVAARQARTWVSMQQKREETVEPLELPIETAVELRDDVRVIPLNLPEKAEMLMVALGSEETVGCAVENNLGRGWQTAGMVTGRSPHIEVRLGGADAGSGSVEGGAGGAVGEAGETTGVPARYRLRIWSLDNRHRPIELRAMLVVPVSETESQLGRGIEIRPMAGLEAPVGVARIAVDRPGLFRLEAPPPGVRWCPGAHQMCREVSDGLVSASGAQLWLTSELEPSSARATLKGARVALGAEARTLQVALPSRATLVCDLDPAPEAYSAVVARACSGVAGVQLGDGTGGTTSRRVAAMGVGGRSTFSALIRPSSMPLARVWQATESGEKTEARLEKWSFGVPVPQLAGWGATEGSITGIAARSFDLPQGPKRIVLTLGRGMAAVLSEQGEASSTFWHDGSPFEEQVETTASRLTVFHLGEDASSFEFEVFSIAREYMEPPLRFGQPYERHESLAGIVRLPVDKVPAGGYSEQVLHLRGAGREATVVTPSGMVFQGRDVPVQDGGGIVLLEHGPGFVLAWIDAPGMEGKGLWGGTGGRNGDTGLATTVSLPATLTLQGSVQTLRVAPDQAMLLHVRSEAPNVTQYQRGQETPGVAVLAEGGVLDIYLAGAPVTLTMRGVGGADLWGEVQLVSTPVTPIGEGLGPAVLLGAGGTRFFSFQVPEKGPVGLGVRADREVVTCTLSDRNGQRISEGLVQMPVLEPGTYFLSLHLPENEAPVQARPAIVGIAKPAIGPPEESLKRYLELAEDGAPILLPPAPVHPWAARWTGGE